MNIRIRFLAVLMWLLLPLPVWAAVNVNTATPDELRTVRGIGPAIAKRIIDERGKGPFKSLDDLQARVRGIGEATARKFAAGGLIVGPSSRAESGVSSTGKVSSGSTARSAAVPSAVLGTAATTGAITSGAAGDRSVSRSRQN
jgi:competence protein ComEA